MTLKTQFDAVAESYDKQRRKFIPCFDDFYGLAIDNLVLDMPNPKILDLGAGTGLFSALALQKYPSADITLIDLSDKMLGLAEKRFRGNNNIHILCEDFTNHKFDNGYDAVISSLAIHHLDDERKIKIYNTIYNILNENGLFIHAEQVEGETPYLRNLNNRHWIEKVEQSGLSREEINAGYERVKLDKRVALSVQLQWLKDSGFSEVDCIYKYYDFTVIYCKK